jgi:hypothetical protein
MLTIETITEYSKFETLNETWNALLKKSHCAVPYMTYEWFKIAYKYLDNGKDLHIILVKDNDKIITIAPLLILRSRLLGLLINKLCFIKNSYTPFQDFILTEKKRESIKLILKYLKEKSRMWNLVELKEMRADSITVKLIKELCSSIGLYYYEEEKSNSFGLRIEKKWDQTLKQLKPKIRREFKRKCRRLEELGEVTLQNYTELDTIKKHLGILFNLYANSWKGSEKAPDFYYQLAEFFVKNGNLLLYTLLLDNKPIGYLYTIKYDNTLYCIKTTYDSSYTAFSPGIVLTYKSIKNMHNIKELNEFDIGRGEERYKKDWNTFRSVQITSYLGNKRLKNYIYFAIRFSILPFCRLHPVFKYLIPVFKIPMFSVIKFKKRIKNDGLLECMKETFFNIKSLIYYKKVINILKFRIPINEAINCESMDLTMKYAQPKDKNLLAIAMKSKNFQQILKRLKNKDKCIMVLKNNEIKYYFWFKHKEIFLSEINKSIRLEKEQVFLYDYGAINNIEHKNVFMSICKKLSEDNVIEILAASNKSDQNNCNNYSELGFKKYKKVVKRKIMDYDTISQRI